MSNAVNLLLVDDRPENLLALEIVLGDQGCNLVKAKSGGEALRCVLQQDFAAILLDVQMPTMDGFETASLIRERDRSKHTPIIFITAIGKSEEYVFKGYTVGAVDYVIKPIVPEILKAKVAVFVDLFRMTEQIKRQSAQLAEVNQKLEAEIAERQQAEKALQALTESLELRVAQRTADLQRSNTELEQFAYVASHDLQEPLRVIASFVQLLERRYKGKLDADADKFIQYIVDGAKRMQQLINDLLAYSRVGTKGKAFAPTPSDHILNQVLSVLQMKIEENHATVTHDPLPTVMADDVQLAQLFQNLLVNAIKFHSGDPLLIHISAQLRNAQSAIGNPKSEIRDPKSEWLFSVRDNGIGIAPENFERIFVIFQRLHSRDEYPGTGIGLTICRKIVERHGGRIWVESELGKGATFYFTLPVSTQPTVIASEAKQSPPAHAEIASSVKTASSQ